MADTHRRVEPRSIIGTGMATDPERIRDVEARAARYERDHSLPKKRFGEVIQGAPARPPEGTEWPEGGSPARDAGAEEGEGDQPQERADASPEGVAQNTASAAPAVTPPRERSRPVSGPSTPGHSGSVGARKVVFKV